MSRVTPYVKTTWADRPSTSSSIDATNLNHIEQGVKNVTDAVNEMVVEVEPATASKLGGIKVGSGLSVTQDGTLSTDAQALEPATASKLGGIKVGSNLSITQDGTLSADSQQYTLPPATQNTLGGIKVGSGLSVTQDGQLNNDNRRLDSLTDTDIDAEDGQILRYIQEEEEDGVWRSVGFPIASASNLGGIKVGENLSITQDGTLSATGGGSAESMTYEETINVLDESSYIKVKLFQTARTISESGPWNPSPQPLTISEDGLITFSPTGIADVSGIYLGNVIDLEEFTIPIGSKLVFSGKGGEDLYFTYQGNKVELVDGKTTIAMNCSSGRLALYIVVTNGKTYDISCVPEVWIPQT